MTTNKIIKTTAVALAVATLITATACEASASGRPGGHGGPLNASAVAPALKGEHGGHGNYHPVWIVPNPASGAGQLPAGALSTASGTCSCGR